MTKRKILQMPMWFIIAFGVALFTFVYFFTKPRNSTGNIDNYVSEYIDNSIEISFDDSKEIGNGKFDEIYTGLNFNKLHRSKLSSVSNNHFSFYNNNYNKYFKVILIGSSAECMQVSATYINSGAKVKARVNQWQLNDFSYGTKENPIPILYLEIPKYEQSQGYHMIKKTPEQYKESVYYYLSYLMPKDEFSIRFSSSN